jgi:5,10-methylenetetrahydromethanopterin reductase
MKFGFITLPHWPSPDVVDLIEHAENLGYDFSWIPDQTFFQDPFVLLAVAGQRTSSIQLAMGVTNPYTRAPHHVARSIGTTSELVGRPIILGIGAGNRRELLLPLGLEQISPVSRIREMIEVTIRLLKGETVSYKSDTLFMEDVSLKFKPTLLPPVYVAARGPGMLRLSGEVADGVIIGDLLSDNGLDYAQGEINKGIKKAGRKTEDVKNVCWAACFVTDGNDDATIERLKPWIAHNLVASPPIVQKALQIEEERIEMMRSAYFEGGSENAAPYVKPEDVYQLSVVGSPDRLRQLVMRLGARGISQLVILLYSRDLAENQETMQKFAEKVIQKL